MEPVRHEHRAGDEANEHRHAEGLRGTEVNARHSDLRIPCAVSRKPRSPSENELFPGDPVTSKKAVTRQPWGGRKAQRQGSPHPAASSTVPFRSLECDAAR